MRIAVIGSKGANAAGAFRVSGIAIDGRHTHAACIDFGKRAGRITRACVRECTFYTTHRLQAHSLRGE